MNWPAGQLHHDAAVSAHVERQTQAIQTRVWETRVKPTRAAEIMSVTDQNIPDYAEEWGYDRVEEYAYSRWLADGSSDIPWADVAKHRQTFPVRRHGIGYYILDREAERSAATGQDLSSSRAMSARKGAERFRDRILIQGDSDVGLEGIINNSYVPTTTDTSWSGTPKTTVEMLADLGAWLETARGYHKGSVQPDTLLLPPAAYNHARVTKETGSDLTTLEFLLRTMESSGIKKISYLDELTTAGVGATTRAILYANEPDVVQGEMAHFYRFGEAHRGLRRVEVPGEEAIGGCHIYFPPGFLYIDGV